MNLTALFNKNYLMQNIKKSKAILLLCIIAMPIINALILLFVNSSLKGYSFMSEMYVLNGLNFAGMYIIPEVIAVCLYNYIFNKKSVDFVGSMPINRKAVFFTNLIGGIGIIVLIQLLIAISTMLLIPFLDCIFIVPEMVIMTFLRYTLYYIFIYATAVLALSLSNNIFVQVVLVLLITFFVPFLFDSLNFVKVEKVGITSKINIILEGGGQDLDPARIDYIATAPYYFIKAALYNDYHYNQLVSNIIMAILAVIYSAIAGYFFYNKKMEHAEEGITSEKAHIFVKALTLLPFITFYEMVLTENLIGSIVFFVILFVYSIIYDIITKRKISLKIQIVSFIVICAIYVGAFGLYSKVLENEKSRFYHKSDIASINVGVMGYNGFSSLLSYDEIEKSNTMQYNITDESLINYFMTFIDNRNYDGYTYENEDNDYGISQRVAIKINFKDGKSGFKIVYVRGHALEEAVQKLSQDSGYNENVVKDLTLSGFSSTEVIFDNVKATKEMKKEVLEDYNKNLPTSIQELYENTLADLNDEDNRNVGTIFKYKDNKIIRYKIPINKRCASGNSIAKYINNQTLERLKQVDFKENDYIGVNIAALSRTIAARSDYKKALLCRKYETIRYSQNSLLGKNIAEMILNESEDFDINKEYYAMILQIPGQGSFTYFTNKVDRINQIIEDRYLVILNVNALKPVYDQSGNIVLDEENDIVYEDDEGEEYYIK